MTEEAIRLDEVCLWRRTQEEFSYDLKKTVLSVFEGKYRQPAKKLVLDKIDLVVEKGEKIGITGSNGARDIWDEKSNAVVLLSYFYRLDFKVNRLCLGFEANSS